jgi:hypothetical protein
LTVPVFILEAAMKIKVFSCSGMSGTNLRNTPGGSVINTTLMPGEVGKVLKQEDYKNQDYVLLELRRGPQVLSGWASLKFGKVTEIELPESGSNSARQVLEAIIAFCQRQLSEL